MHILYHLSQEVLVRFKQESLEQFTESLCCDSQLRSCHTHLPAPTHNSLLNFTQACSKLRAFPGAPQNRVILKWLFTKSSWVTITLQGPDNESASSLAYSSVVATSAAVRNPTQKPLLVDRLWLLMSDR